MFQNRAFQLDRLVAPASSRWGLLTGWKPVLLCADTGGRAGAGFADRLEAGATFAANCQARLKHALVGQLRFPAFWSAGFSRLTSALPSAIATKGREQ